MSTLLYDRASIGAMSPFVIVALVLGFMIRIL